jgi:microcystin-dependent protein
LAASGGEETHQLTIAELASHTHTIQYVGDGARASNQPMAYNGVSVPFNSGATGGDTPHNNMQPFLAINFMIKT